MLPRVRLALRRPLLRPAAHSRRYTAPTTARSSPALAYAETSAIDLPPVLPPAPSLTPLQSDKLLHLPTPLPGDAQFDSSNEEMYPSTNIVNAISMISICLRRKETIPRAYQVFSRQLELAEQGRSLWPDATIWGKTVEGLASFGRVDESSTLYKWFQRAQDLVSRWETVSAMRLQREIAPGEAVLDNGGIQIYTGLLHGLFRSRQPLEPLLPYFRTAQLPLMDLMAGIPESEHPAVFARLRELAKEYGLTEMEKDVDWLEAFEAEQREAHAREYIPPANPVSTHPRESGPAHGDPALAEARFSIANFRESMAPISTPALPAQRQLNLETATLQAARSALTHAHEVWKKMDHVLGDANLASNELQALMFSWLQVFTERLSTTIGGISPTGLSPDGLPKEELETGPFVSSSKRKELGLPDKPDETLYPYLSVFEPDKLALVTILELMRAMGVPSDLEGVRLVRAASAVGKAVEIEYRADTIRDVTGIDSYEWKRILDKTSGRPSRDRVMGTWKQIGDAMAGDLNSNWNGIWTPPWTEFMHINIGAWLLKELIECATVMRRKTLPDGTEISEEQAAFSHLYEYVRGKKIGLIRANPAFAKRIGLDDVRGIAEPRGLPMLVKPRPWKGTNNGGYLEIQSEIMRYKERSVEQAHYLTSAIRQKNMEPVLHGLDVLSTTPWKINRAVFDVVLEAWNKGDRIADIPPSEFQATYDVPADPPTGEIDPRARANWIMANREIRQQQKKDHGERCNLNYKLEVARSFLNETFYIPHNMDFRGRAYPLPPYLAPVGDDLSRGLLLFAEKKPLGKTGLYWLQVQLANLRGDDKASFDGRVQFAKDHVAEIHDSADHPLDGKRWWLDSEDPWQCLAACIELSRALRSEDPEKFESSLPVHQDGTCNGMQHYAALGGDELGARSVNLVAGERPADIYTAVLNLVNKVVEKDRAEGVPVALLINKPLTRKVVKQTVMTTVYGVTFLGAKDQIAKQLKDKEIVALEHISAVAVYLARTTIACIGDLFRGAKNIMDFLTSSAKLISRSVPRKRCLFLGSKIEKQMGMTAKLRRKPINKARSDLLARELMTSVIWTTPLGMPVVQPYRKLNKKQVLTALQTVFIHDSGKPAEVNPGKQSTAFPPNFIHSLDATHMLLTSLQCRDRHITFAAVHDSYWTHASTVEEMSGLIRDSFIELHSQDLIGQLREEFVARYEDHLIPFANNTQRKAELAKLRAKSDISRSIDIAQEKRITETNEDIEKPVGKMSVDLADDLEDEAEADVDDDSPKDASEYYEDGSEDGSSDAVVEEVAKPDSETPTYKEPNVITIGGINFIRLVDLLPPTPKRGTFDVRSVKQSKYFFS